MKTCKKCKKVKPNTDFYKNNNSAGGLMSMCRPCHYETMKHYYNTEEGRNKLRKGQKKYALKLKTLRVKSLKYADPQQVEVINKLWRKKYSSTDPFTIDLCDRLIEEIRQKNKSITD